MPALFIGHGSPMNAIEDTPYSRAWAALGRRLPRPRAILAVSAHWVTRGVAVAAQAAPTTLHDFGRGFPQALFDARYPAPGAPDLVGRVAALAAPRPVRGAQDWGLDHGVWSILVHMYPGADVPVAQLSLDAGLDAQDHYDLARGLRPLRDEGVLILASGNIVHNLAATDFRGATPPHPWAERFETAALAAIRAHDHDRLIDPTRLDGPESAVLAIQGPEHYVPLLYALAQQDAGEPVEILQPGVTLAALSMASVVVGSA
jgi:4,5-DOPA dioxygenase extradiol